MDFEIYRDKIKQVLIAKASNNLGREAIIELKEIDLSIKTTNDLTVLLQEWLEQYDLIEKAIILGKGCIQCVVKKEFLE